MHDIRNSSCYPKQITETAKSIVEGLQLVTSEVATQSS